MRQAAQPPPGCLPRPDVPRSSGIPFLPGGGGAPAASQGAAVIHTGDCLDVMPTLPADSVDAIVTDPPYGLEFMGKEWDRFDRNGPASFEHSMQPGWGHGTTPLPRSGTMGAEAIRTYQGWCEKWAREALRVAKPGAYLLAFGGTRTVHRLTCAIEDAGWVIRDVLVWAYAQGFPKSRASLKPAWEPIVMARKSGASTPLQIDAARIGTTKDVPASPSRHLDTLTHGKYGAEDGTAGGHDPNVGRWPANVILTDPIFDGDVDGVVGGGEANTGAIHPYQRNASGVWFGIDSQPSAYDRGADTGTYSRFFLVPKADRAEREPIWGSGLPTARGDVNKLAGDIRYVGTCQVCGDRMAQNATREHCGLPVERIPEVKPGRANSHPTVKPLELMRHLVRLVTPPGGLILDPFLGSGTTAIAAEMEGFPWVGIEREPEYVAIAEARLLGTQRGLGLEVDAPVTPRKSGPGYWPTERKPSGGLTTGRFAGHPVRDEEVPA